MAKQSICVSVSFTMARVKWLYLISVGYPNSPKFWADKNPAPSPIGGVAEKIGRDAENYRRLRRLSCSHARDVRKMATAVINGLFESLFYL
jgi:hypothetical protein